MRIWLLLLLPVLIFAQPEFFGYFESEVDALGFKDQTYFYHYNKLRLDVEARPADNIQVGANLNVQQYLGKTTWDLMDFIPGHVTAALAAFQIEELPYQIPDTSFIDNFYARIRFPRADLTLGKQQLSFGTGYAWNPTDIFNFKQLLDPSYEQTGVSAIRLELPLAARLNIDLLYGPEEDWENSTKLAQAKLGIGRFDLSAVYARFQWYRSDFFVPSGSDAERSLLGGSLVGELLGLGVWIEAAQNRLTDIHPDYYASMAGILDPHDEEFTEYVIGLDYTFESSTYVLFEYLHNGGGKSTTADLNLNDYVRSLGGETHSLMQNYGFLYAMHPVGDFGTLGLLAYANFDDESAAINPSYDWAGFENLNFSLMLSYMLGDDDTEFGVQDWGLRFRVRAYF
jgi:hypothetical protein